MRIPNSFSSLFCIVFLGTGIALVPSIAFSQDAFASSEYKGSVLVAATSEDDFIRQFSAPNLLAEDRLVSAQAVPAQPFLLDEALSDESAPAAIPSFQGGITLSSPAPIQSLEVVPRQIEEGTDFIAMSLEEQMALLDDLARTNPNIAETLAFKTLQRNAEIAASNKNPLSVKESIEKTFAYHKSLRVIQENRESLRYDVRRAQAGWGPSVDIRANLTGAVTSDQTTRLLGTDGDFTNGTGVSVVLSQPIWDGLATYHRVEAAKNTLFSVESRVIDTATTLALDTLIAHEDVLRRREIFQLSINNVQRHKESLEIARMRSNLGLDTEADVSQADGRYARALSSLSETNATLIVAQDTFSRLTGLPIASVLSLVQKPDHPYASTTTVLEQAIKTNPKWVAYKYDIEVTRADKNLALAAFSPIIDANVTPSYEDDDGRWSKDLTVGLSLTWNVFNSGADMAAVNAAKARIRESTEFRDDFWDDLTLEVQTAWTDWKAAIEQQRYYEEAQVYNQQTLQAYQEQFANGSRPILDVLDAESELYNTSVQAITARSNAKINVYKLYALTGELLNLLEIPPALYEDMPEDMADAAATTPPAS